MPRLKQRIRFGWMVPPFYWACVYALRGVLWIVGRWEVQGRENIPDTGPVVVVSNHLNNADPPILSAGIARRRVRFMAKVELFKMPFGVFIRGFGAFPVRRFDADVGALLGAERILKNGELLGMFPEGTRSRTGKMGSPHPGTALIALRSGAMVLPCAMTGTERLRNPLVVLRKPRITVTIGEPIVVEQARRPTEEQVSDLTKRIYERINAMLPPEYQGSYTGVEVDEAADGGNTSSD